MSNKINTKKINNGKSKKGVCLIMARELNDLLVASNQLSKVLSNRIECNFKADELNKHNWVKMLRDVNDSIYNATKALKILNRAYVLDGSDEMTFEIEKVEEAETGRKTGFKNKKVRYPRNGDEPHEIQV